MGTKNTRVRYCTAQFEQLRCWQAGQSMHDEITDTCCPDFSCCRPQLRWSRQQRKRFVDAVLSGREPQYVETLLRRAVRAAFRLMDRENE